MDHFDGIVPIERFNNELLSEIKRTNVLLEQIVQLLQPKIEKSPIKKVVTTQRKSTKPTNQRRKIS